MKLKIILLMLKVYYEVSSKKIYKKLSYQQKREEMQLKMYSCNQY